jgi:hypothetical protein
MVIRVSTDDATVVPASPALPVARNTAPLAAAVASITLVLVLEVEGLLGLGPAIVLTAGALVVAPAVWILRDSAAVSRQVGAQATASGTRRRA